MRKIILAACSLLTFAACKNSSEEVTLKTTTETTTTQKTASEETAEILTVEPIEATETKVSTETATTETDKKVSYASFGKKITAEKALNKEEMLKKYKGLKTGDTINVKFASTIKEVCKKKGCWMSIALPNEKESFVKFKDYAFFVPLNADKSDAIISGKAFVDVVPVAELQHYAKDGGKSAEEIAKITEPKVTYAFQADGVLIRE